MKLPSILTTNPSSPSDITIELLIPDTLEYFSGHFPGTAILAGVVQTDWAMQLAEQYFENVHKDQFSKIDHLKFSNVILPESTLYLDLSLQGSTLKFKYSYKEHTYSSGKIQLQGQ
jgi:3-hydroxymyristoyl/3-hydroxydecanoyl-(acyl carrier protein) dehydratase